MSDHILTINAGSSSLKFALFTAGALECVAGGQIDGLGTDPNLVVKDGKGQRLLADALDGERFVADHDGALHTVLGVVHDRFPQARVAAVGHRVVHGGIDFAAPVLVAGELMQRLVALIPLAPLHQPHNLAGIAAAQAAFPGVPQVACFDTAFHREIGRAHV